MVTIDHLPLELLSMILHSMDSAQALHSLISADARAFRTFRADRSRILRSVLQNAIFPDTLRDLLFTEAIKVPRLDPLFPLMGIAYLHHPISREARELKRAMRPWIERYFIGEPPDYPTDTTGIVRLLRICAVVSRFADNYARHAAYLLVDPGALTGGETPRDFPAGFGPLTKAEKRRFQRAFLRYELYSRFFRRDPTPPAPTDRYPRMSIFTGHEQYRLFIRRLDPWGVEELSCVHNFLFSIVRGFMAEVEDQIVRAVRTAPGACKISTGATGPGLRQLCRSEKPAAHTGATTNARASPRSPGGEMVRYKDMFTNPYLPSEPSEESTSEDSMNGSQSGGSESSDSLFDLDGNVTQPHHTSKLTSYGLPFLRRLLDAETDTRKDMMRREGICGRDFLPEALDYDPDPPAVVTPDVTAPTSPARRRTAYRCYWPPSCGSWSFLHRSYRRIYDYYESVVYNPARERAYVFWDQKRLDDPVVARNLQAAANVSAEEVKERTSLGPTVEERVWDIRLPRRERRRIREEFGFYDNGDADSLAEDEVEPETLPGL